MKRLVASALAGLLVSGCATAAPPLPPRAIAPDMQLGALGHRTNFELGDGTDENTEGQARSSATAQVHSQDPGTDAPAPTPQRQGEVPPQDQPRDTEKKQRFRNGMFWAGVALAAVGGTGVVGFAGAGQGTEVRLNEAYDGSLSRERERRLRDTGAVMNGLAIASAGLAVLGVGLLSFAYGLDYTVCGKLAKRRKKCREAR